MSSIRMWIDNIIFEIKFKLKMRKLKKLDPFVYEPSKYEKDETNNQKIRRFPEKTGIKPLRI